MNRLLLIAVCAAVALSGVSAFGQYVVAGPVPVAVYRPVPVAIPITTVYQPVVPAYAPVVAYRPMVVPAPVPVVYGAPAVVYAGRPAVVRSKVYLPGQPVRNILRAVTP